MTEKLYYKDVNLKEFTATVQTVKEQNGQIELHHAGPELRFIRKAADSFQIRDG